PQWALREIRLARRGPLLGRQHRLQRARDGSVGDDSHLDLELRTAHGCLVPLDEGDARRLRDVALKPEGEALEILLCARLAGLDLQRRDLSEERRPELPD